MGPLTRDYVGLGSREKKQRKQTSRKKKTKKPITTRMLKEKSNKMTFNNI